MSDFRRRQMMVACALPYDAEVEYLKSTGWEYIDTGLINSDLDEYYIKFYAVWSSYRSIFGNYVNEDVEVTRLIFTNKNSNNMYSNVGSPAKLSNMGSGFIPNQWNQAWGRKSENIVYFKLNSAEEVQRSFTPGSVNNDNIVLFGGNVRDTRHASQIARMQFKKNGILVRDFIPVRVGSTGYMYDRVSGTLFGNAGTGNFILGPDI